MFQLVEVSIKLDTTITSLWTGLQQQKLRIIQFPRRIGFVDRFRTHAARLLSLLLFLLSTLKVVFYDRKSHVSKLQHTVLELCVLLLPTITNSLSSSGVVKIFYFFLRLFTTCKVKKYCNRVAK